MIRLVRATLAGFLAALAASPALAQSIDLGRGEIPLTVPERYDPNVPTPLIVALHGYTSSGDVIDRAWGISEIADAYNVLTIAQQYYITRHVLAEK